MRTQRLITYAFATCLILLVTGSAIAHDERGDSNALLKGAYRIFTQSSGVGSTAHFYFAGVITYDGKGNARMTDRGTIIDSNSNSATAPPSFGETGIFTYEVKRDGSFTQEGIFTSDPADPFQYTITSKWVGQISAGGLVLILSGPIPTEPGTFCDIAAGACSPRFSGFSGTAVRIRPE